MAVKKALPRKPSIPNTGGHPAFTMPYPAMNPSHIVHRHLHHQPPRAVGGHGIYLTGANGQDYLDASGGAAVSCLGHGHPDAAHRSLIARRPVTVGPRP